MELQVERGLEELDRQMLVFEQKERTACFQGIVGVSVNQRFFFVSLLSPPAAREVLEKLVRNQIAWEFGRPGIYDREDDRLFFFWFTHR